MRTRIRVALIVLTCVHAGCRGASVAADIEALNHLQKQVDAAIVDGDTERYVTFLSDDAVLMPPNQPSVVGKDAIRTWNAAMSKQARIARYEPTDNEVVIAGDWAFRRATFEWTMIRNPGGEEVHDVGKFIIIYKRHDDGSWRVARDIWNSSTAGR